jgi:hypothetical protein
MTGSPRSLPTLPRQRSASEGVFPACTNCTAALVSLTLRHGVVIFSNTKAELLLRERHVLDSRAFVELVVWRVPKPVRGSRHDFKYRLAFVVNGTCVLRYDNEAGKGDHRHIKDDVEEPYAFIDQDTLLGDFWCDVHEWRQE